MQYVDTGRRRLAARIRPPGRVLRWAIAAAVVAATAGALAASAHAATVSETRLLEERVLLLQGYIETHALRHYYVYPLVDDVRAGGALRSRVWPEDPWTGAPMSAGTSTGHYTYTVAADRRSYRLVGHLPDGAFVVTGAMPHVALTAYKHREQEGLSLIRQYVEEWAWRHGGIYPPAPEVARDAGVGAVRGTAMWPSNPWNHGPMGQSNAVGDFTYRVAADGSSYRLSLHIGATREWVLRSSIAHLWREVRAGREGDVGTPAASAGPWLLNSFFDAFVTERLRIGDFTWTITWSGADYGLLADLVSDRASVSGL